MRLSLALAHLVIVVFVACKSKAKPSTEPDVKNSDIFTTQEDLEIAGLWIAQTHVLEPTDANFRLVAEREALLKVNVIAREANRPAPAMNVVVILGGKEQLLRLQGPAQLPTSLRKLEHSFTDSYTVMIPKEWIQPGLMLKLKVGGLDKIVTPKVGAPNPLSMTFLRFNIFKSPKPLPEPAGWEAEFKMKLPIASFKLRRQQPFLLKEVVIPPRPDVKLPAIRASSPEDYANQAKAILQTSEHTRFDGEQGLILGLTNALQLAAGHSRLSIYYAFVDGVGVGGGLADSFTGMGIADRFDVLLHEVGHTLSLPHWAHHPKYPYQGDKGGIQGDPGHVGNTWGFDSREASLGTGTSLPYFIPPTVQVNAVGRSPGVFKKDPMAGGGSGDQEKGFIFRMFSDFSTQQMQGFLERELVLWGETQKSYVKWDDPTQSYQAIANAGVELPQRDQVAVYSLLYAVSPVTESARLVYAPLGPYESGLIKTYDPSKQEDRLAARGELCVPRCDFTLQVTQKAVVSHYIVPGLWHAELDALQTKSLVVGALNVPASAGAVTQAVLLHTPDVAVKGMTNKKVLAEYKSTL